MAANRVPSGPTSAETRFILALARLLPQASAAHRALDDVVRDYDGDCANDDATALISLIFCAVAVLLFFLALGLIVLANAGLGDAAARFIGAVTLLPVAFCVITAALLQVARLRHRWRGQAPRLTSADRAAILLVGLAATSWYAFTPG